jgi:hypothetical protein
MIGRSFFVGRIYGSALETVLVTHWSTLMQASLTRWQEHKPYDYFGKSLIVVRDHLSIANIRELCSV